MADASGQPSAHGPSTLLDLGFTHRSRELDPCKELLQAGAKAIARMVAALEPLIAISFKGMSGQV